MIKTFTVNDGMILNYLNYWLITTFIFWTLTRMTFQLLLPRHFSKKKKFGPKPVTSVTKQERYVGINLLRKFSFIQRILQKETTLPRWVMMTTILLSNQLSSLLKRFHLTLPASLLTALMMVSAVHYKELLITDLYMS